MFYIYYSGITLPMNDDNIRNTWIPWSLKTIYLFNTSGLLLRSINIPSTFTWVVHTGLTRACRGAGVDCRPTCVGQGSGIRCLGVSVRAGITKVLTLNSANAGNTKCYRWMRIFAQPARPPMCECGNTPVVARQCVTLSYLSSCT